MINLAQYLPVASSFMRSKFGAVLMNRSKEKMLYSFMLQMLESVTCLLYLSFVGDNEHLIIILHYPSVYSRIVFQASKK